MFKLLSLCQLTCHQVLKKSINWDDDPEFLAILSHKGVVKPVFLKVPLKAGVEGGQPGSAAVCVGSPGAFAAGKGASQEAVGGPVGGAEQEGRVLFCTLRFVIDILTALR